MSWLLTSIVWLFFILAQPLICTTLFFLTSAAAVTPARLVVLGGHGSAGVNRAYTLSTVETLAIGVPEEPHHPEAHHIPGSSDEYFKGDTWLPEDGQRKGWLKKHWRGTHTHHHQFFVLSHQPGRHGLWYYDHQTELDHLGLSEKDRRMRITEIGIQPAGIIHTQNIQQLRAGLTPKKIEHSWVNKLNFLICL